jgi:acyl-homoserine lactone acylase PvdQ
MTFRRGVTLSLTALCVACATTAPPQPVETATIYRDTWGVPHIEADTEAAGFYALGYAQAQDRLPELLGSTLWVRGRLAEIMGDASLAGDIESRRWLNFEEGAKGFARLSPQLQRDYAAFVAGAKKFMAENPKLVPPWAPDLTPETLTALTRNMSWIGYNQVWGPAECSKEGVRRQLIAESGYPSATHASNEWAVFPSRTANGETILLADPHVEVNNPFYYEYRMKAGNLFSSGFAAGAMLWQSQNRHVAWAFTTGHPDMWDCYAVETDPKNPRAYLYDGKPMQMEVRKETFKSASGKVVEQEFEYTRHNGVLSPVVRREGNVAYVVSQSQMDDGGLMDEEIYRMNRATSVKELRDALKTLGMMAQNLMAIDDQGHGYYLHAGKTPKRPQGYDFTKPVPGNTSATAWQGFHPLDDMIEVTDPPQGYMQNDNSSPDVLFADGNIDAAKYPADVFYDTNGRITTRGVRSLEFLSKAQKLSIDDAKAFVFDEKWTSAKPWQDALRYALKMHPKRLKRDGPGRTLADRILAFDGFAHAESSAALNVYFWRDAAGKLLEEPRFASLKRMPWRQQQLTAEFRRAILDATITAADAQVKAVGSLDAPLGKLFRAAHGAKSWPLGGVSILPVADEACLWQAGAQCDRAMRAYSFTPPNKAGERIASKGSQAPRLIVFGKSPQTWTLFAFGQQSTPGLPHADDQAPLFSRKELKPALLDHDELMQHVESKITLQVPR